MSAAKTLTVRLPEDEHNLLRLHAFLSGASLNETILMAIRDFLASHSDELFEKGIERIRTEYRVALDKLADV
jgi:hypothetical protein